MKIQNKKRLIKEIANNCDNPWEFIRILMAMQNLNIDDVSEVCGLSTEHLYVMASGLRKGHGITVSTCEKVAKGINVDPYVLNRVVADHAMKMHLMSLEETEESLQNDNN
jgi:hypothetical protein